MANLVRWDVPFADAFYPSVTAKFETATQLSRGKMDVTIGVSDGTSFRVEATTVLGFTCLDEGCAPQRWFSAVDTEQVKTCAYQCLESPWIESYRGCQFDADGPIPLNHYLIYGGDNIIEFVCQHEPTVSTVND